MEQPLETSTEVSPTVAVAPPPPMPVTCRWSTLLRAKRPKVTVAPGAGCTVTSDEYAFAVSEMFPELPLLRQITAPPVALFSAVCKLLAAIVAVHEAGVSPEQFGPDP